MTQTANLDDLFTSARTHRFFTDQPVSEATLRQLYDLAKFPPTESNFCPMRLSFVASESGKAKLLEAAAEGNKPKIESAPVVAILAHDLEFHTHLGQLAPHMDAEQVAARPAEALEKIALQNSWMQAGYLILAARAVGLDCGPMIGFDKQKVNAAFYAGSSWRVSMLISLGYGNGQNIKDRAARLDFDTACQII